ncbi:MAG: acetate--CoA ligase family protein [Betaproteobacteria bacterium]|nr:acetate--CoA ligase family protein [Betaproteobacteria bacterium]
MKSREVYRRDQLVRAFAPRSIAVVGVSKNPAAFGSITFANIVSKGGYAGPVYPVNAKYDRIGDAVCYASISDLPETPDCVFIAVPREGVEALVTECARRGVGGVVIFSSGYSETGKPDRARQQARLVELANAADLRIVGPNCVGMMNYGLGMLGTFGSASFHGAPRAGAIGLVSQSGAVGAALVQAMEHGVSFSHMLTSGNACDVDAADQVAYLAEDPACRAVACLFEGMADPMRMMQAAELCRRAGKPLVVHKIANSERGAQAAVSHTGSVAGSQAAYRAAFERAGAVMVDEFEALIETAVFFAKAPPPRARGIAIAAVSGGACIMLADKAEAHGIDLPQPAAATVAVLERIIPEFGTVGNPCDVTAQVLSTPEHLYDCFDALLADPNYGALVMPHMFAYAAGTSRVSVLDQAAARHGKIACSVWLTQYLEGPGALETELSEHVAMFRSMSHCLAAIKHWHQLADSKEAGLRRHDRIAPQSAAAAAASLIDAATEPVLSERDSKQVLAAYGIAIVEDRLVQSAQAAVEAAQAFGAPVALKVESPDIPHKTEAGVVRLQLESPAQVRAGFEAVFANAMKVEPKPRIAGVLVQPMVPAGTEIMVGARIDAQFGPMIVVGLGGIFVELMKDTVLSPAPVSASEALAMLQRLRGRRVLEGFRGSEPVDQPKLAEVIARLSEFAADQRERIAEFDVNPLICAGSRIVAVDALIVKRRSA